MEEENPEDFDESFFDFKAEAGNIHSKPVILDAVFNKGESFSSIHLPRMRFKGQGSTKAIN